jgi:hypothetical protein
VVAVSSIRTAARRVSDALGRSSSDSGCQVTPSCQPLHNRHPSGSCGCDGWKQADTVLRPGGRAHWWESHIGYNKNITIKKQGDDRPRGAPCRARRASRPGG